MCLFWQTKQTHYKLNLHDVSLQTGYELDRTDQAQIPSAKRVCILSICQRDRN